MKTGDPTTIQTDLADWPFGMSGHDAIRECYRRGAARARSLAMGEAILAATGTTITEAMEIVGLKRAAGLDLSAIMREAIVTKLAAIRALGKDES